jgi:ankyrin repeat protein
MFWSQNVTIYILFSYLLPSLPVHEQDCWSEKGFQSVLEYLMTTLCNISPPQTQESLKRFVMKIFCISHDNVSLDEDLFFLGDIQKRCFFTLIDQWESSVHSLYASSILIEHKADIHAENNYALRWASKCGYKDTVVLLLEHRANIHADEDHALRWASEFGHKDVVALLLENKANAHVYNNAAILWASRNGHTDTVALLLKYKPDIHRNFTMALEWAIENGQVETADLLLRHGVSSYKYGEFAILHATHNRINRLGDLMTKLLKDVSMNLKRLFQIKQIG